MDQNLKIIEKALNLKLSDEQLAILESHFETPTLVNACAGAGKTTTMIISILYQAMCKHTDPENVLAITFSHDARDDMENKYTTLKNKLAAIYPPATQWQKPTFSTFHALFLSLLKQLYPNVDFNIVSWSKYAPQLYKNIKHPQEVLTNYENVKNLTEQSDWLINHGYSYDGTMVNTNTRDVKTILANLKQKDQTDLDAILNYIGIIDENHIADYTRVIKQYNELKHLHHEIDFNDMQGMLLNALKEDPARITQLQALLSQQKGIKQVYLDEFQDISPIQWTLTNAVLTKEIKTHLVAIGDDDQSIYRFRGSDPHFILTFNQKLENAKKFNLSTNYRTSENILNVTKPMIESNTLRLVKSLKAYNAGGKVAVRIRHGVNEDPALDALISDIKDNPEKSYAIFARNNSNLSIISDILAEHDIYPDFKNNDQFIFQNTKIYQIYVNLIRAIYKDDFDQFTKYSNRIGFNRLKKFLEKYTGTYKTITEFFNNSTWLADLQQIIKAEKNPRSNYANKENLSTLLMMKSNINQIKDYREAKDETTAKYLPVVLFNFVDQLTKPYFDYMLKNHYMGISNDEFNDIHDYLKDLVRSAESTPAFFIKEQTKLTEMLNNHDQIHIEAMTFHRSKGLEFDETLLYTTSNGPISKVKYQLSNFFPANDTIEKTVNRIIDNPTLSLALMDANALESMSKIRKLFFSDDPEALDRFNSLLSQIEKSNFDYLPEIRIKSDKLKKDTNLQRLIFLEINNISKSVEEEKRLLYVAVTRAKEKIIFDQSAANDIITEQLKFKPEAYSNVHSDDSRFK